MKPIEKAFAHQSIAMHHPVITLAQLPQQRQPGVAAVGFKVANVRAPVAVLILVLLYL